MDKQNSISKLFTARLLNTIIGFGGITLFARQLGSSGIGEFFLFQAIIGVASIIADGGLRGAAEKRISEGETPGEFFSTALVLKSIGIITVIVAVFVAYSLNIASLDKDLAFYIVVGVILREYSQLLIQNLNAEHRVSETAPILLIKQIVWVGLGLLLIYLGYKTEGVIIAYLTGISFSVVIAAYKRQTPISRPSTKATRSLIRYAKYDAILGSGYNLLSWLDVLVIGFFLSSRFVGAYEMAWKVAAISVLLSQSIYTSIFPEISALETASDRERISKMVSQMLVPSVYFVLPALFGALVISEEVLVLLFGDEYKIASTVLVIFMLQKVFIAYDNVIGRSLQALNVPKYAAYPTIIGVVVNAILNVILVYQFGIIGGAIATLLATVSIVVLRAKYLLEMLSFDLLPRPIGWCLLAAGLMALLVALIEQVFTIDSIPSLFLVVIVAAGWYLSLSLYSVEVRKIMLKLT